MAKRKLKHRHRSLSDQKKRINQSAIARDNFAKDGITFFKPAEGANVIRILPPQWEDADHFGYDIYIHYNVGSDKAAYLCPRAMKHGDQFCPICEEKDRAEAEGEDEQYTKSLRPKKRVAYYLVNRDKPQDGILFWPAPWTVDKDIVTQSVDTSTQEYIEVDDPDEGYDVTIHRKGTTQMTEYTVSISRRQSDIELTDEQVDFMEENPIPEILIFYPAEHIKKVFEGGVSAQRGEVIEESLEKAKSMKLPSWNKLRNMDKEELEEVIDVFNCSVDSDDFDDEEDLAEAIAEELGIEKPKSKGLGKVKQKEPEPEPEEEDPEEEELAEEEDPEEEEEDPEEEEEAPPKRTSDIKNRLRNLGRST